MTRSDRRHSVVSPRRVERWHDIPWCHDALRRASLPRRADTPCRAYSASRAFTLIEMLVAIGIVVLLAALTITASISLVQRSEINRTEQILKQLDIAVQEWETRADRKLSWGVDKIDDDYVPFDITDGTPHVFTVSEVLKRIRSVPEVRSILANIPPEFVYEYQYDGADPEFPPWLPKTPDPTDPDPFLQGDKNPRDLVYAAGKANGQLAILDAWGTPIRAVHPGRVADPLAFSEDGLEPADLDGTIRIHRDHDPDDPTYATEEVYGVALERRVLFVSAGPDGKFGTLSLGTLPWCEQATEEQASDNVYSYEPDRHDPEDY